MNQRRGATQKVEGKRLKKGKTKKEDNIIQFFHT